MNPSKDTKWRKTLTQETRFPCPLRSAQLLGTQDISVFVYHIHRLRHARFRERGRDAMGLVGRNLGEEAGVELE